MELSKLNLSNKILISTHEKPCNYQGEDFFDVIDVAMSVTRNLIVTKTIEKVIKREQSK